jgi:ABC-type transport system substrate-binding protein
MTTSPTSTTDKSRTLRIGVVAAVGTLDPREMGDTITGLVLGQIFEMAYRGTPSGAIEPHLFAEPLREERSGAQPAYSAAVREGIVFSDGTPLTAELAAASLAKAGALRGRATVSARGGRVHFTMSGPSPRFENVLTQWNCGIVLEKGGTMFGTGAYRFAAPTSMLMLRDAAEVRLMRNARYAGTAHADELVFAIYSPDSDATPTRLIEAAKNGQIDVTLHRVDPSPASRKVITDLIESEAMMVPLIYGASTAIRARNVKDFHITPSGHVSFADIVF